MSPEYLNSLFASPEWASAFVQDPRGEKGILLPVRVREFDLSGFFKQLTYIDLVGKNEKDAKGALLSGVQRERAKPLTPPEFPKPTERLTSQHPFFPGARLKTFHRKSLLVLMIFSALVIGGLYVFLPRWWQPPRSCAKSVSGDTLYYEAEDAELWGSASKDSTHPGFSGDGFVSGYGEPEAMTTFRVDVPTAGEYQIDLCYANATNSAKMLSIYVNEERIRQTRLPNGSRWNMWLINTEALRLKAGRNEISYRKTSGDTGQVNLDFIGVLQKPTTQTSPQPTTTPMPTPSVALVPSPSTTQETTTVEPTEEEMKEALLREMEKRGAKRNTDNGVTIENPIAEMTIKIERFVKVGCKPATYGVGFECTYTIKLSYSFHSTDGTKGNEEQFIKFWNRLVGGSPHEEGTTKKFARSSEGWLVLQD